MTKTRQKKPATRVETRVDALELRVAVEKASRALVLSETDCQYLLMPIRLSDGRGMGPADS